MIFKLKFLYLSRRKEGKKEGRQRSHSPQCDLTGGKSNLNPECPAPWPVLCSAIHPFIQPVHLNPAINLCSRYGYHLLRGEPETEK